MPGNSRPQEITPLSATGGVGMLPVYGGRENQILMGYEPDPNYAPPIIEKPKPASILALEKQLGNTFDTVYAQKQIAGPHGSTQTVSYGPPIGYRIDPGNSTYVNFDASGTYSNTIKRGGALSGFEPLIGVALNFIVPGLGEAITASLVSAGVVSAGAFANALGAAIANATVSVAQGVPLETALRNAVVNTVVNTGSQPVASAVNEIIGKPDITNALVSAAGSAVKTSLMGGSADDIARAATAGLVSSAASSAYIAAVDGASQATSDLIGATVGGAVTGGEAGAITAALNQLASRVGKKTLTGVYKTAADIEEDRLVALDEADAAVEKAFATVTPTGTKTAEDIEYEKQKALDDADAAVNNMFASVTVQATQNVTQSIINLIAATPTPIPGSVLQQVTVAATPTVSVSPTIQSTVGTQVTQNVTQKLVDAILKEVTVSSTTPTVIPTLSPTATVGTRSITTTLNPVELITTVTPSLSPTVTTGRITVTPTLSPTATVGRITVTPSLIPVEIVTTITPSLSPTATVGRVTVTPTLSPVTVRATQTVFPSVDIVSTPTVTVSPTIITVEPSPSPTVKYSPTIKIVTTVTPPKPTVTPPSKVLSEALKISAYRGAGEIEDPSTGKKRSNVWNESSLRLKDALGI
jgi:hypothetical protein